MARVISGEFSWFFVEQLLDWVLIVTACYTGAWLVRVHERRSRPRSTELALRRRVRELERTAEEMDGQLQRLLDADHFASALRLRSLSTQEERKIERRDDRGIERIS
jgi:hypothetical protein